MTGIYKITNKVTGQIYIGQSRDIMKRFSEHINHKQLPIGKDIEKYGIDKFIFEIIELCPVALLDGKEDYYIKYFNSIENGYNILNGGSNRAGENNTHFKLTSEDVYNIREAYNNREPKWAVYELYKDKITKSYFSQIWEGRNWTHIHMDVYTEDNKQYHWHKGSKQGELSHLSIFTDDEIIEYRQRYHNGESIKEIYNSIVSKKKCSYSGLYSAIKGASFKHLPL